jgi:hypothetical protein
MASRVALVSAGKGDDVLPDEILNILTLKCALPRVQAVLDYIRGDASSPCRLFDLTRVVPMPPSVERAAEAAELGNLIQQIFPRQWAAYQELLARSEYDCLIDSGYLTSEDWAWSEWGTPRNVCRARYNKAFPYELSFSTLYAPPLAALAELSRGFPDVVMQLYYEDENLTMTGWAIFADGDVCHEGRSAD